MSTDSAARPTTSTTAYRALESDLQAAIGGEVRFDAASRAMWSADASNYRGVPIGVIAPRDAGDVEAAMAVCREHDVPVLPVGSRTSIAGQAVNTAVAFDFRQHMDAIIEVDPDARTARVQPGAVCDAVRDAGKPHGLTFGPDPSTHNRCSIGGMIGNNACGSHSVAWGKTVDNVRSLDVLTYRGERITLGGSGTETGALPDALRALGAEMADDVAKHVPELTRRVSGYNLDQLVPGQVNLAKALVGTEGTCATILEATVDLVESPPARALAVLGFPDAYHAADNVMIVREHSPLTIEGMDAGLIASLRALRPNETTSRMLPEGKGWLYVETGGSDRAEAEAAAQAVTHAMRAYTTDAVVVSEPAQMAALWRVREEGAGLLTRSTDGGEAWPGWEDAAVPPERFGAYLREFDKVLERHGRKGIYYGHFGDGCLHVRIDFDLLTKQGVANFREFMTDAADTVVAHGGSLSGEHGDGQARAELLPRMYPPQIITGFERFKEIWDPDERMNPGRVVRPATMDENLRVQLGMPTMPDQPKLAFSHDRGSFHRATRRCLGVGKCAIDTGSGVMCPSWNVTKEEKHSTRGRARLLFEMANGEVITDGWQSDEVAESLDLCLSCKGCKSDCPVGVDMATYKTEFLANRYHRKLRPRAHYSMGALPRWMRVVGTLPAAAVDGLNKLAQVPFLAKIAKKAGGIDARRAIPPIARETYTARAAKGAPMTRVPELGIEPGSRGPLLLWTDTFTDHFDPDVAADAVAVLTALGYRVELPPRNVCCGLTWTSTGQVTAARRVLARSLRAIGPALDAGIPVVGLEPSCTAALRSDAAELLPDEPRVTLLGQQVSTFAELLGRHADELSAVAGEGNGKALVQIHCHQHAELGSEPDRAVLKALGVDATVLDSGCCGLAGNFGFEDGHYDVSMACAERALLPAVRAADDGVDLLADGYSCRTQVRQAGEREPVHLAQIAARALRG
ncbi:FAD-binding and (Fe-S)-binding domain-containing protein [Pseudonocardia parietis]|uniref:FAD/FMN-containing dehydrogenase/Fe-S oxidoreductase n=1 Tax=Pseudonocardia parietis TaxID=570936 RepID=A0ABS4VP25_9PSEU|nr:FAD-binding and (Fe-S)-binding domain-containing protein [Pseudonocardia parietis]MBP2365675.1 FAD/FMN-containing dehydrogenase/Fe-S oxidoreductase [Pseudonocardia parietis]